MSENNIESIVESEEQSLAVIQDTMSQLLSAADVERVYGEPIEKGEALIIPSAEVLSFAGIGAGSGYGAEGEGGDSGGGGGGGGGGRVLARPVAVIIAEPGKVRVEPVIDITKVALAALTAAGFMLSMLVRMNTGKTR